MSHSSTDLVRHLSLLLVLLSLNIHSTATRIFVPLWPTSPRGKSFQKPESYTVLSCPPFALTSVLAASIVHSRQRIVPTTSSMYKRPRSSTCIAKLSETSRKTTSKSFSILFILTCPQADLAPRLYAPLVSDYRPYPYQPQCITHPSTLVCLLVHQA